MNIFDFFASTFCAALSGTGLGGGGLYVIYLTMLKDIPQLTAQGMNLAFFISGAVSSMLLHLRKRKFILPLIVLVSLLGTLGSLFGAFLAQKLDTVLLSKIFGGMLVFTGLRSLFSRKQK